MNKKQGKPLKMRLFFFLVTHIDGNRNISYPEKVWENRPGCIG